MLPQWNALLPEHDGPSRCYEDSQLFVNYSAKACDYRLIIGLNEIESRKNSIHLMPNPVVDYFQIKTDGTVIEAAKIYDVRGKLVKNLTSIKNKIDVSFLENGIYFVQLITDHGLISNKIVVSK